MKTLFVTLVLALLLMTGSALKCNNCISKGCYNTVETCGYKQDACVSAIAKNFPFTYFRRCIAMSDCFILQASNLFNVRCCQTDRCN
ncbi:CD59B glycoprotein-like [Trichomycterus rosablanca]|uniref:CD59B glycoprotein-like n=1 Tax=Trichomycterus rosablanca TaxID=2290929 RepID=UPI002F355E1E